MKRIVSCVLAFLLVLSLLPVMPVTVRAASESDLTFKLNSDGKSYAITKCSRSASGELWIPETYKGKPVTAIGDSAFYYCTGLEYINIPIRVKSIGNSAFYNCIGLKSIGIGIPGIQSIHDSALDTIGDSAFYNCTALKSVSFPNSLTTIGNSAFYGCETLTSLSFPRGVQFIGSYAFKNCANLERVTLPSGLQTLGADVFQGCSKLIYNYDNHGDYLGCSGNAYFLLVKPHISNLSVFQIHINTKHIYSSAFNNYPSLSGITIPDGVCSIGASAFYHCSWLKSITIPDSVKHIDDSAFSYCTGLTSVTIGDGVQTIGASAFSNCSNLSQITFGKSVTSVGWSAFSGCRYLYGAHITDLAAWCQINFYDESASPLWQYGSNLYLNGVKITDLVIPNGVTSIGSYAFSNCDGLRSVTIPDSVEHLDRSAFAYCLNLTSLVIGNGVQTIGENTFHRCDALTNVWYTGTANDKSLISINYGNSCLTAATWHYNLCTEEHIYSSDCDVACDTCDWPREPAADHIYVADCAAECVLCSFERNPWTSHTYNSMCDTECIFCGAERIAPHRYSGICDPQCNDCGINRTPADHTYTSDCDVNCNICLATRKPPHHYDGDCDIECNDCSIIRIPKVDHTYTNACDTDCTICGAVRTITHDYTDATCEAPATCKVCGNTNGSMLGHSFTNYASNHDATCLEDGTKTAKCDRCAVIDTVTDEDSQLDHSYTTMPEFHWSDDYSTCSAAFTCVYECGHEITEVCAIIKDTSDPRQTVYTAKVTREGIEHTDTTVIAIAYIPGDFDGDSEITDWDGVLLARYLAGWTVEVTNIIAMDIDGDGEVTDWDGVILDRHLAGWNVTIG